MCALVVLSPAAVPGFVLGPPSAGESISPMPRTFTGSPCKPVHSTADRCFQRATNTDRFCGFYGIGSVQHYNETLALFVASSSASNTVPSPADPPPMLSPRSISNTGV